MTALITLATLAAFGAGMISMGWDLWIRGCRFAGVAFGAGGVAFLLLAGRAVWGL